MPHNTAESAYGDKFYVRDITIYPGVVAVVQ